MLKFGQVPLCDSLYLLITLIRQLWPFISTIKYVPRTHVETVLLMAIKTLIWYSVTDTLLRLNMCLLLLGYLVGFILILDAKFLYFLQIFSLGLDYCIPIKALIYQLEL